MTTLKNILVHLDDAESRAGQLRLCAELAGNFDARLSALYVGRFLTEGLLVDAPPSGTLIRALEEEQQHRIESARATFDKNTAGMNGTCEFHDEEGEAVHWLSVYARYADIVVVRQPGESEAASAIGGIPGALALGCGRPLLVVPRKGFKYLTPRRVMIAWNGSREATRAVADALPLLKRADWVEVVSVFDGRNTADGMTDGRALCRHLGLNGIEAAPVELSPPKIKAPDALLSRAAASDAELIVLGAYGHSRFRELVLGGVTRHLLNHSAIPLLLSH